MLPERPSHDGGFLWVPPHPIRDTKVRAKTFELLSLAKCKTSIKIAPYVGFHLRLWHGSTPSLPPPRPLIFVGFSHTRPLKMAFFLRSPLRNPKIWTKENPVRTCEHLLFSWRVCAVGIYCSVKAPTFVFTLRWPPPYSKRARACQQDAFQKKLAVHYRHAELDFYRS